MAKDFFLTKSNYFLSILIYQVSQKLIIQFMAWSR